MSSILTAINGQKNLHSICLTYRWKEVWFFFFFCGNFEQSRDWMIQWQAKEFNMDT